MIGSRNLPRVGAIVAALLLGVLGWGILLTLEAATTVTTREEVRLVDPWKETGAFGYEPLLADGSGALPMGEPGYFTTQAPHVRLRFEWGLDDPGAERVSALGSMRLVGRAEGGPGRVSWSHTEPLANATMSGDAKSPLTIETVLDLPALAEKLEAQRRHPEDARWTLVATVRFTSLPDASHAADASEFSIPFTYAPPLYVLPGEPTLTFTKDHSERTVTQHTEGGGVAGIVADPRGPALLALAAIGLLFTLPRVAGAPEETP